MRLRWSIIERNPSKSRRRLSCMNRMTGDGILNSKALGEKVWVMQEVRLS